METASTASTPKNHADGHTVKIYIKCRRCGVYKPPACFHRDRRRQTGRVPDCKTCVKAKLHRWYIDHRDYVLGVRRQRVFFRPLGRRVSLPEDQRTGVCSRCGRSVGRGEIPYTQRHHYEYYLDAPQAGTRELCPSCHTKVHREMRARGETPQVIAEGIPA